MFVLTILYPHGILAGFAKATKTCPAAKWYWRPVFQLVVQKIHACAEFSIQNSHQKCTHARILVAFLDNQLENPSSLMANTKSYSEPR